MPQWGPSWPQERTQRLLTLYALGKADYQIAELLGVSKGAVIGKRQRLKLFRRPPTGSRENDDPLKLALDRASRERRA